MKHEKSLPFPNDKGLIPSTWAEFRARLIKLKFNVNTINLSFKRRQNFCMMIGNLIKLNTMNDLYFYNELPFSVVQASACTPCNLYSNYLTFTWLYKEITNEKDIYME